MTRCHYPQERDVREPHAWSAEAAAAEGDQHLLPRHAAGRLQDRHQVQLLQTSTLLYNFVHFTIYISKHVFQGVISILAYISFKIILLRNLLVTLIYRTIILLSIHSETTLTLIG